jgi:hypothetical protein
MDLLCPETAIDWSIFESLTDPLFTDTSSENFYEQYFDFQAASTPSSSSDLRANSEESLQCGHLDKVSKVQNIWPDLEQHSDTRNLFPPSDTCLPTFHDPSAGTIHLNLEAPAPIKISKRPSNEGELRKKKKRLNNERGQKLNGCFIFPVNSDSPTFQQRAPYTAARKAEVNQIRALGACLRCKVLKKPVSWAPEIRVFSY